MIINLRLFEGEGSGEGTSAAAGQTGEGAVSTNESQPAIEDRHKSWETAKNEFKDLYQEDTQRIINKRFKETKELEGKLNSYQPLMDVLSERYGTSDVTGLMDAINNDSRYWEEVADENGMTVEQYREYSRLKRENDAFKRQQDAYQKQKEIDQRAQAWYTESQKVKEQFPDFDLGMELNNSEFQSMLRSGVPMAQAYKVLHFDELMNKATASAEKAVTQNIQARGQRPQENGTVSQGSFTVKDDVRKLTKEDRAKIAKLVEKGEHITFRP